MTSSLRAFSRITGVHAPDPSDWQSLPKPLQMIYYTLLIDQLGPVRIVLGYGGYKTERGLRDGLIAFLDEMQRGPGLGVPSFPHLITCNGISLVKGTGQPYMYPMQNGRWDFMFSSPTNPVWIMLELLWAKVENICRVGMPWADDLVQEVLNPFLTAEPIVRGDEGGWMYRWNAFKEPADKASTTTLWEPIELSLPEYVTLQLLGSDGSVDTNDADFGGMLERHALSKAEFIRELQRTGLVALEGSVLRLATKRVYLLITPDGRYLAGEHEKQVLQYVDAQLRGPQKPGR